MSTPYRLGVDLGTTWTAAAVQRGDRVEALALGTHGAATPSVLALDGETLVAGERAERLLAADPTRGVRECKRRLGDATPMVVGSTPYGAEALLAGLLAHVLAVATEREGAAPASVTLTHPAAWGDYKLDLLRETGRLAGVTELVLCSEPEAAARHYVGLHRIREGERVAVYDFGGGTFDVAVVACTAAGTELLGTPDGLDRLGGIDLDQIMVAHVDAALDGRLRELDPADPDVRRGLARLRADCTAAKEALSTDAEATVAVALPGLATEVRITRDELEAALRPRVVDTLRSLDRAVAAAGLATADLAGVLLVGGSSRIPLVAEEVARHTGRPVLLDADPKLVVALGAVGGAVAMPTKDDATHGVPDSSPPPPPPPPPGAGGAEGGGAARKSPVVVPVRPPVTAVQKAKGERGAVKGPAVVAGLGVAAAGVAGAGVLGSQLLGDDDLDVATAAEVTADLLPPADESLDAFEDALAAAPADAGPTGAGGGFASGGGGGSRGGGGDGGGGGGGGGGSRRSGRSDDGPDGATRVRVEDRPGPTSGTDPAMPAPVSDFDAVRATLQERLDAWVPPEGADPEQVAEMRAELEGLLDRYQPRPGQSDEDALADLRQQFDDQVEDFAQDIKLDAVIDELQEDDPAPTPEAPTDGRSGFVWEEAETLPDGTVVPAHWERERAGAAGTDPTSAPGGSTVTDGPVVRDHRGDGAPPPRVPTLDPAAAAGATIRDHRDLATATDPTPTPSTPTADDPTPSPPSQGGKPVQEPADADGTRPGMVDVFDDLDLHVADPTAPTDPAVPTDAGGPSDPAAPTDPAVPTDAGGPSDPAAPTDPATDPDVVIDDVLGVDPAVDPAPVPDADPGLDPAATLPADDGLSVDALGISADDLVGDGSGVIEDPLPDLPDLPLPDVPELDPDLAASFEDDPSGPPSLPDLPDVEVDPGDDLDLPPLPDAPDAGPGSGLDDDDALGL